jgi:hypothetical protein
MKSDKTILEIPEMEALIEVLKNRFHKNIQRHKTINWKSVFKRITTSATKLWSLSQMEDTGGEPDVVDYDQTSGEFIFYDCSPESPAGRRSCCYDPQALALRKENKPAHSALGLANFMGVEILTEQEYRYLQTLGKFDVKTSSWVYTPADIRTLGGALFCDRRYNQVFLYHNGAESYYAARGFRAKLRV